MIDEYSEIIESTIADFVKNDWQNKFFDYISESDIRSYLYVKLMKKFSSNKIKLKVSKMSVQDAFDNKTVLIHCEMAIPEKPHRRHLDIGIWAKDIPDNIVDYKSYPVCIGIEIKYFWLRKPYAVIINGITNDVNKLLNLQNDSGKEFKGYVLAFFSRIDDVCDTKKQIAKEVKKELEKRKSEFKNTIEIYLISHKDKNLPTRELLI